MRFTTFLLFFSMEFDRIFSYLVWIDVNMPTGTGLF